MWQADNAALAVVHGCDQCFSNQVGTTPSTKTEGGHRRLHVLLDKAFTLHDQRELVVLGSHEVSDCPTDTTYNE